MTPEEKIEALRKLFDNIDGNIEELKQGAWWDGFYWTRQKVRDIIDPPAPQWRQRVDALHPEGVSGSNLGAALYHLSHVANPDHYDIAEELANIVVVCETAVGGGWRANPDDAYSLPSDGDADQNTVMWLLDSLVRYSNYRNTGNRAAYWLRHLTDGGAE